jgi:nucleolar protein 9
MARRLVQVLRDQLGENEVRAMAASKVAGPGLQVRCYFIFSSNLVLTVFQVLLEVEADQDMANEPGSLMDRVMVGLITSCREFRLFCNSPSPCPTKILR